ncbi:alpha-1,2-fucosyltransferase [Methylophilus sp. 13]|uniref:alpha-1,2-fucosyltransferase n=1 Tax=Methylophilus sp. 13 TaxID=2781018 RepID=UPI00188FB6DD|nr:alpha-1,2-fucosyltransferase [Methylophilus sp. 13]
MITVRVIGGLGNQMFQYAAGRSLSIRRNDLLKLDITGFENYVLHDYGLNHFNAIANLSTSELLKNEKKPSYQRFCNLFNRNKKTKVFKENGLLFNPLINNIKGDIYLDGYWQSEQYFKEHESIIRSDFRITTHPSLENLQTLEKINSSKSISLHIRRGDYVNNSQTNAIHGVCSLGYYQEALQLLKRKLDARDLHVFVFSDDHSWVEKNLIIDAEVTYVRNNSAKTNYEDLRLMSACQHHIIANSSFSWWGAWLNPNTDKIVIAPKNWFKSTELNSKDIIPSNWIRL